MAHLDVDFHSRWASGGAATSSLSAPIWARTLRRRWPDRHAGRSGCPHRPVGRHRRRRKPARWDPNATPPWLLGQRRASRQVAYRRLGVRACRRDSLKLTARKVDDAGIDIGAALSEILDFSPGSADSIWVVAPWRQEPHPDHAAVGHAAAIACHAYSAQLLEYPVGVWHRDDPAELPWVSARTLALSPLPAHAQTPCPRRLPAPAACPARRWARDLPGL